MPCPEACCRIAIAAAGQIQVDLTDNGPRFDRFDPGNAAGYGLALVRALVRSYSYAFSGAGNQLSVHLALPPA